MSDSPDSANAEAAEPGVTDDRESQPAAETTGDDSDPPTALFSAADCRFLADPTAVLDPSGATDFDQWALAWQAIADRAPAEIADATRVVADAVTKLATLAAGLDLSDPQALADPQNREATEQVGALLSTDTLQSAAAEVAVWAARQCAEDAASADEGLVTGDAEPAVAGRPSASIPEGFPEALWLPEGLEVLSATAASGEWSLTGQIRADDPQALAEAFVAELTAAGWEVGAMETRGDSIQIPVRGFDTHGFVQVSQPPLSSRLLIFVALGN